MPNSNYIAGRQFEYAVMQEWRDKGYSVARTAGSHGAYDVVAFRPDKSVELIQCKRVSTKAEAARLIEGFKESTVPSKFFHQVIAVKIKGTKSPLIYTV